MKRVTQRISPEAYSKMREVLAQAEGRGCGPTEAAAIAMNAIGIGPRTWPPEPQETELVVDYSLRGTVYPFTELDSK